MTSSEVTTADGECCLLVAFMAQWPPPRSGISHIAPHAYLVRR